MAGIDRPLAECANFNSTTRDIGSGTRNEGDLNLGLDPSWGSGERDRSATAAYDTVDYNGNPAHVNVGDEASPLLSLSGTPCRAKMKAALAVDSLLG